MNARLRYALLIALGMAAGAWFALRPEALPESAHAAPLASVPVTVPEPVASSWLNEHFAFPMGAQGTAPAAWTALESSLRSQDCGACHVAQFADWTASLHARAWGPGMVAQLPSLEDEREARCHRCHAPLAEQMDGGALAAEGVSCAVCHVRRWARHGPERAPGQGAPHGGYQGHAEFEDPAFCGACHDFGEGEAEREGKRLQETGREWARSPQAAAGKTCQSCHMPEGRHLWKGIHDPETVKLAIEARARFVLGDTRVVGDLRLTNTGAGHRLPTYTTPQLTLVIEQVNREGESLDGTVSVGAVARRLSLDTKTELFDTRLLPGETHTLRYESAWHRDTWSIRAAVEVWPDEAYRRLYERRMETEPSALYEEALKASIASRYVAWEEVTPVR
jgi:hypothetical protein